MANMTLTHTKLCRCFHGLPHNLYNSEILRNLQKKETIPNVECQPKMEQCALPPLSSFNC